MVAAVQANLLFQSLGMTREEILEKYPINNHNKTETLDEDQCSADDGHKTSQPMGSSMPNNASGTHEHFLVDSQQT